MAIKYIYTLFLALLISLFIGFGIDAFYPGPVSPSYPAELNAVKPGCEETPEQQNIRKEYNQAQNKFMEDFKPYNRDVSVIALTAAILILIFSMTMLSKIKMIADGVLLGGVFITIYSIIRGIMSQSSQFRFLIVSVGLVIALILGYLKFIKTNEKD